MRRLLAFLAALGLLALPLPAMAQLSNAAVVSACGTPPYTYSAGQTRPLTQDTSGKQCSAATATGTFVQDTAGAPGAAVPASADYQGVNVGGNLRGQTGVNPSGSTYAGDVHSVAAATGGASVVSKQVANNTTSVAICASACTLYGVAVQNNSATIAYLKLYNTAQGSVTCGTPTPVDRIMIPVSTTVTVPIAGGVGAAYGTALTSCVTTGIADNDTAAPAANAYQLSFYVK